MSRNQLFLLKSSIVALLILLSSFLARADYVKVRDVYLQQAEVQVPGVSLADFQERVVVSSVDGLKLQAWGSMSMDSFRVDGVGQFYFTNAIFQEGQPSGITMGRWRIDGIKVRLYEPELGFEKVIELSLQGDWNKDPQGGNYYSQDIALPEAFKAKLKHGQTPTVKSDIIDHGRMSLDSLPLEQIKTFSAQKIAAQQQQKQAEQLAQNQANNSVSTTTPTSNTSSSQAPQVTDQFSQQQTPENSGESRQRQHRLEREAAQREQLSRQADNAWDGYQNVLKGIDDAFKVNPNVQRQRELEAEEDEREYLREQRRRQYEDELYWAEQDRKAAEQAARQQQVAEARRSLEEHNAAYRAERERNKKVFWEGEGARQYFDQKFKWMNDVASSLVTIDKTYGFEGNDATRYKSEYASPQGLYKFVQKILLSDTLSANAKASMMNSAYVWYRQWVILHQRYNFYPDQPACPDCRTGEISGYAELSQLFPYFKAWTGYDVDNPKWGVNEQRALLSRDVTVKTRIAAGEPMAKAWNELIDDLNQYKGKLYPSKVGMQLQAQHLQFLQDFVESDQDISYGTYLLSSHQRLQALNLLIADNLSRGRYADAYLLLHQAYVITGMQTLEDLFQRPVFWRANYKLEAGPETMMANEHTANLVMNAAYVYLFNGHWDDAEWIFKQLAVVMTVPSYAGADKNANYYDLAAARLDLYAHQQRWPELLTLAAQLQDNYRKSVSLYAHSQRTSIDADQNSPAFVPIKPGNWGLYVSRQDAAQSFRQAQAYQALALKHLGKAKDAKKALKPLLDVIEDKPALLASDPYLVGILEPLLLQIEPKKHQRLFAKKAYQGSDRLANIESAVTLAQLQETPEFWYQQHQQQTYDFVQASAQGDYTRSVQIASQLAPTQTQLADQTEAWPKSAFGYMFSAAIDSFYQGNYLQGMGFAEIARRLSPEKSQRAEYALILNALFGNINHARLNHFGPWLNQGSSNGNAGSSREVDNNRYYLVTALEQYSLQQAGDNLGQLATLIDTKAKVGDTRFQVAYLLGIYWRVKNPWAR